MSSMQVCNGLLTKGRSSYTLIIDSQHTRAGLAGPVTGLIACAQPAHDFRRPEAPKDVLTRVLNGTGRRAYRLTMENGTMVELAALDIGERTLAQGPDTNSAYLVMRNAAKYLRHGYTWISRNWRSMGLHPRRVGRVLFFARKDLDALIDKQRPQGATKRKKVIGIVYA